MEPARPEMTWGAPEPTSPPVVVGGTDIAAGSPPDPVVTLREALERQNRRPAGS